MTSTDEGGGPFDTTRVDLTRIDDSDRDATRILAPDGDDITVVPGPPNGPSSPAPRRRIIAGFAIGAALAAVVGVAIAARHSGSTTVRTDPPVAAPANTPIGAKVAPPTVHAKQSAPSTVARTTLPAPLPTTPVTQPHVVPPPATLPAPTTPTTVAPPKQYGATALTWTAPRTLTIVTGATATLAVTAHNPTDGTVTLAHPLACTPRLDHGEMCAQVVQLIASGQSASAQYTIDAGGLTPGPYTLNIEGVLTVAVTVTAS